MRADESGPTRNQVFHVLPIYPIIPSTLVKRFPFLCRLLEYPGLFGKLLTANINLIDRLFLITLPNRAVAETSSRKSAADLCRRHHQ